MVVERVIPVTARGTQDEQRLYPLSLAARLNKTFISLEAGPAVGAVCVTR
jgi:hypothetical protein